MIKIRLAHHRDAGEIARLWRDLLSEQHDVDSGFNISDDAVERWLNDFKEWVEAPDVRHIIVADSDDGIAGFASAQLWWPPPVYEQVLEVYLDELYVRPSDRRKGIGSQIMTDVLEWARDREARCVRLGTLSANAGALEFWTKKGAAQVAVTLSLET
jgi:GNAT superfamily N-acetyltransferase